MRGRWLIALSILVAPAFGADGVDTEVASPRPDAVTVTIYRDLFALITETRTVDLPAGPVTLAFDGVVETLIPQSAVVAELGRPLAERNYDYDPLTPRTLLEKSIGKTVTLTRTLPGRGKVVRSRAVILSANGDGVTLRSEEGNQALHCSGLPEQLTFDELPADLHPKPRLSIKLAAGPAGKRTVRLSYLAHGFAWDSNYVAQLDERGDHVALKGWVTLTNATRANLRDAQVQMVAGKPHLLLSSDGGTSVYYGEDDVNDRHAMRRNALEEMQANLDADENALMLFSGCYATPLPEPGPRMFRRAVAYNAGGGGDLADIQEVMITGTRSSAQREEFGDYHLYRLPWPTDLNARQTKQALFLDKPGVKVDRFYGYRFVPQGFDQSEPFARLSSMLSFENRKSAGLGEPLPAGVFRLFEPASRGAMFLGESSIDDAAVGTPVEFAVGRALDLQLHVGMDKETEEDREGEDVAQSADVDFQIFNAKSRPVQVEIRQMLDEESANAKVVKSNRRPGRKFGDLAWRFEVPANGDAILAYRVRVPIPRDEDD